jgi:hypothetical protein
MQTNALDTILTAITVFHATPLPGDEYPIAFAGAGPDILRTEDHPQEDGCLIDQAPGGYPGSISDAPGE